jgi:hypothetical protein
MTDDVFTVPERLDESARVPVRTDSRLAALRLWWVGYEDEAKVLVAGLIFLGIGCALAWLPLALIVPGAILVLVSLGFSFRRAER